MDPAIQSAAQKVVEDLAGKAGIQVDPVQIVELGEKLVGYAADLIAAAGWKASKAAGAAAAAAIVTEDDAERAQRKKP